MMTIESVSSESKFHFTIEYDYSWLIWLKSLFIDIRYQRKWKKVAFWLLVWATPNSQKSAIAWLDIDCSVLYCVWKYYQKQKLHYCFPNITSTWCICVYMLQWSCIWKLLDDGTELSPHCTIICYRSFCDGGILKRIWYNLQSSTRVSMAPQTKSIFVDPFIDIVVDICRFFVVASFARETIWFSFHVDFFCEPLKDAAVSPADSSPGQTFSFRCHPICPFHSSRTPWSSGGFSLTTCCTSAAPSSWSCTSCSMSRKNYHLYILGKTWYLFPDSQ